MPTMHTVNSDEDKDQNVGPASLKIKSDIKIEEYFRTYGDETQEALHLPSAESEEDTKLKEKLINRHVRQTRIHVENNSHKLMINNFKGSRFFAAQQQMHFERN